MNTYKVPTSSGQFYTPDKWVILRINTKDAVIHKVFAGWYGGYTRGDSWKISSGIVDFIDKEVFYSSLQDSGSTYNLYKISEGMSVYQSILLEDWVKKLQEQGIAVEVISAEEFIKE